MRVPLLVIIVRHIWSPHMAFKMKKQNISFPHGDIFYQAALAVCSDPRKLPSGRAVCMGLTPAFIPFPRTGGSTCRG